jgi:hypothetical protein
MEVMNVSLLGVPQQPVFVCWQTFEPTPGFLQQCRNHEKLSRLGRQVVISGGTPASAAATTMAGGLK